MKIKKKQTDQTEADLTPMIDMVFQLIAFFMLVITFNDDEQHEKIVLPKSETVRPTEKTDEVPLVIHLTKEGRAIFRGHEVEVDDMENKLRNYINVKGEETRRLPVIIRGHRHAETGKVQDLIKICQGQGLEKFALRAKAKVRNQGSTGG
jgi:biopolymer transport protein ExbD